MQVHSPEPATVPGASGAEGAIGSSAARRALAGFFVSGVLLSFLGAILLSWEQHLSSAYGMVAFYFAGLIAGLVGSVWASPALLERKGIGWTLSFACGIAGTAFLCLAFVSPPWSAWWRVAGMAVVGCSAGLLHTAIFHAISPMYRHDPAATVNLAGILFGTGCFTVAMLVSGAFNLYTAPAIQAWLAIIPALFGWMYWKTRFTTPPVPQQPSPGAMFSELRSAGAVLLSLLLFFQLGNEWGLAGWLPLFLSQRLGISPVAALRILAMYWLALLVGRIAAQWILPHVKHAYLLLTSVVVAIFGCVVLSATNNQFGAVSGVLMVGFAFAPIYPLVVEKIGLRSPHYHPGFYNGVFSFAMAGGLLTPCILGLVAKFWGIGTVMVLPLAGSMIVFVLLLLIWLEARLSAHAQPAKEETA
jgi:MFS family permease